MQRDKLIKHIKKDIEGIQTKLIKLKYKGNVLESINDKSYQYEITSIPWRSHWGFFPVILLVCKNSKIKLKQNKKTRHLRFSVNSLVISSRPIYLLFVE